MDHTVFRTSETKRKHELVKLVALRNIPQVRLPGGAAGEIEANGMFETYRWVADELTAMGLAQPAQPEKPLDLVELQKIHFRETIQTTRRLSEVPAGFYSMVHAYLRTLKAASSESREKLVDHGRAVELVMDILTSRMHKIVSIASIQDPTESVLETLTPEELRLYEAVHNSVKAWRIELMRQLEDSM
ncbi:MAG: hypothetical protein ACE5PO_02305 [Candidatus Bathyarchaeia archaeon]